MDDMAIAPPGSTLTIVAIIRVRCPRIESSHSGMERTMNVYRLPSRVHRGILLALLAIAGCGRLQSGTPDDSSTPAEILASRFDASTCGTIRGRVTWHGDLPRVIGYDIGPNLIGGEVFRRRQS